jgi:hypothetical protein
MSRTQTTFVEACLSGEALLDDIDAWVDAWHATDEADDPRSLDEFLGFSEEEGAMWAKEPGSLRLIVAARMRGIDPATLAGDKGRFTLAARSSDPSRVDEVVQWLADSGRIVGG